MRLLGKIAVIIVLALLATVPRVLDLDAFRSPDEDRWMANTNGFVDNLATGRWGNLVQQPHPGITTQWLGALTVRYDSWALQKLPLVIGQILLVAVAAYLVGCLWGWFPATLAALFLIFDPQLYAHTRVYAMDSLLAFFTVIALLAFFVWEKTRASRYLAYSAAAAAAAVLSKLSGIILAPYILALVVYYEILTPRFWQAKPWRPVLISGAKSLGLWLAVFVLAAVAVLPSLALNFHAVIGDFIDFFRSDDYVAMHAGSPYYYLGTLLFFSAPGQWLVLLLPVFLWQRSPHKPKPAPQKQQLLFMLIFAILFTIQMTIGLKKGDRYILPVFVIADIIAAALVAWAWQARVKLWPKFIAVLAAGLLLYQAIAIWRLQPDVLAYTNPLTRHWLRQRAFGWGEGLEKAAAYLNAKPNAKDLKVASFYQNEFSEKFRGDAIPAHRYEDADYVVLYRSMLGRGPDAWETDVLNYFQNSTPEKTINLGGVDLVWIYRR